MKSIPIIGMLMLLFSALALAMPDYADAARMGGGRSFGGGAHMSQPAPRPAITGNQARQGTQQPGAAAPRSGMFGGMGGIMGGLLAGTLLGSMLSGNGFAGGGFMDLILLGILVFLAYKIFTRFRNRPSPAPATAGYNNDAPAFGRNQGMNRQDLGGSGWDSLSQVSPQAAPAAPTAADIPAGFDAEEFLRGAKMAYNRLQQAWDRRDLGDIAQFATEPVMNVLREQAQAEPAPSKTEIMTVNASLLGVEEYQGTTRAQVYFDVLMREDPSNPVPETVREIWHFRRSGENGEWKLDGIQQVR